MASSSRVIKVSGQVRDANAVKKVTLALDTYSHWVLERLTGVKGRSPSDVAVFIVRSWIQDHQEELSAIGIAISVEQGELIVRPPEAG